MRLQLQLGINLCLLFSKCQTRYLKVKSRKKRMASLYITALMFSMPGFLRKKNQTHAYIISRFFKTKHSYFSKFFASIQCRHHRISFATKPLFNTSYMGKFNIEMSSTLCKNPAILKLAKLNACPPNSKSVKMILSFQVTTGARALQV